MSKIKEFYDFAALVLLRYGPTILLLGIAAIFGWLVLGGCSYRYNKNIDVGVGIYSGCVNRCTTPDCQEVEQDCVNKDDPNVYVGPNLSVKF